MGYRLLRFERELLEEERSGLSVMVNELPEYFIKSTLVEGGCGNGH